jgi:uncharacterized damage-inducible protein DinB
MKRFLIGSTALAAAIGVASCAPAPEPEPMAPAATLDSTIASVRALNGSVTGFLTATAEMVPEATYGYRPTPEVRTLGEILGHVADASFFFCSTASGMDAPEAGPMTTKAEIQAALAASIAFCNSAFDALTAQTAAETVTLLNNQHSRIGALAFHNAHIYEHYGNLVTYMRINGMVPPSSQQ